MSTAVFAYGTLEIPEVMEALTGKPFYSVEAVLYGFARFLLRDRPYPGITEERGAITTGRLYLAVDEETLELLDAFEGEDLYERRRVRVVTDSDDEVPAYTYVLGGDHVEFLTSEPWDPDRFRAEELEDWARGCELFRESWRRSSRGGGGPPPPVTSGPD